MFWAFLIFPYCIQLKLIMVRCDTKAAAWRAMRICDILAPTGKK